MSTRNKIESFLPQLRFSEFREDGEWGETPLDGLSKRLRRKVGTKELTPVSITAGFGFVDQTKKFGRRIAGEQYKNYIHIQRGDFVYNKGNSKTFAQGCIYQLKEFEEAAASTAFICFKLNEDCVDHYFQSLFECNTHGRQLAKFITSGARSDRLLNINPTDFFSIELPVPPTKAEQQKIADCLGSLDDLIAAHSRKLAALQDHKKGLLQQLFPAEGETTPKLRFPEFEGETRNTSLGKIAKFGSGGTPAKNEPSYWNGDIPWISASSMHDPFVKDSKLRITHKAIGNGTRIAKKGTLLILVRGSMLFKRVPICLTLRDVAFNQDVKSMILEKGVNAYFLLSQLVSFESRFPINRTGIGAGKIDTDDLKSLELFIPSPAEQQKIADCLNALDALISAQTEQLAALKEHKKGLKQQLFPNPELSKA